jgi:hypothetical protein
MLSETESLPCPRCNQANGALALVSVFWCDKCKQSFTPLESRQAQVILKLTEKLKQSSK